MAVTQRTIVLNDFGLARRERTSSSGTAIRYTVSIEAAPLVHVFDAKALGQGPAQEIAEHLRRRIETIQVAAAPATLLRRKYAESALDRGAGWASNRYSGGRTGTKRAGEAKPDGRLFNDSGRFAAGLIAQPTRENNWVINVPANRLDPSTFRDGEAGLVRMVDRLRELVPEFGNANELAKIGSVRAAIGDSVDRIFMSGLGRSYSHQTDLRTRVRAAQMDAIREALQLAGELGLSI